MQLLKGMDGNGVDVSLFCFRGARALHFSYLNHPLRPRDDLGGIGFTSRPSDDTIFCRIPKNDVPWVNLGFCRSESIPKVAATQDF